MKIANFGMILAATVGLIGASGCGLNTAFYQGTEVLQQSGTPSNTGNSQMSMTLIEQPGGRARGTYVSSGILMTGGGTVDATFNGDSLNMTITGVSTAGGTSCLVTAQGNRDSSGTWTLNAFPRGCNGTGSQGTVQIQFHKVN